jgi:hypothetical protein
MEGVDSDGQSPNNQLSPVPARTDSRIQLEIRMTALKLDEFVGPLHGGRSPVGARQHKCI